jgi:hypothetical protein
MKRIFVACDKDKDGYLDRSDLEDVKNEFGLEGDICTILQQFGSNEDTGKISFDEFVKNSRTLFGDFSGSDSSREYNSTDSETFQQKYPSRKGAQQSKKIQEGASSKYGVSDDSVKYNGSEDSARYKISEDSGNCKTSEDSSAKFKGSGNSGKRDSSESDRYKEFLSHMDVLVSGKEHCDTDFMEISKQVRLHPNIHYSLTS